MILDEPASGLDPRARVEIRELLGELANMGKTIFFSSHILADVEDICSHIGIVEAGELIMQGSIDELKLQLMAYREIIITVMDHDSAQAVLSLVEQHAQCRQPRKRSCPRTAARASALTSPATMKDLSQLN